MRTRLKTLALVGIGQIAVSPPSVSAQSVEEGLAAASFLVGCWAQSPSGQNGLREIYAHPAENMMTGLSQFWRGGRIVDFEFHRIDASPEGPVLTPHPRGVASVSFRPAEVVSDRIVWENLEHDFPQRIIYERVSANSLAVRIEGGDGAEARSLEWRMARTDCPE